MAVAFCRCLYHHEGLLICGSLPFKPTGIMLSDPAGAISVTACVTAFLSSKGFVPCTTDKTLALLVFSLPFLQETNKLKNYINAQKSVVQIQTNNILQHSHTTCHNQMKIFQVVMLFSSIPKTSISAWCWSFDVNTTLNLRISI